MNIYYFYSDHYYIFVTAIHGNSRPIMCSTLDDALFQSLLWLTQGLNTNNVMQVTTMYILGMLRLQSQHNHKIKSS